LPTGIVVVKFLEQPNTNKLSPSNRGGAPVPIVFALVNRGIHLRILQELDYITFRVTCLLCFDLSIYLNGMGEPAIPALRVVIADDSPAMRDRIAAFISLIPGLSVVGLACDGREALSQIRRLLPDIVLLDLRMPRMGGLGVLEALREERIRPTVIVLTNEDREPYSSVLLATGAHSFISKDTDMPELERLLRQLALQHAALLKLGP
jgi:CheY-like chemotaxis protein